ncbi:hypothetical protein Rs2_28095 [Raphanus sativus]|nr:hypothetical protein Rs2_28095 [Raphanus sativus]
MSNPWTSIRLVSALFPPSLTTGEQQNPIPPLPPHPPPPDSSPRLSLSQYPPLASPPSTARSLVATFPAAKESSTTPMSLASQEIVPTCDIEMPPASITCETQNSGLVATVATVDNVATVANVDPSPSSPSSPKRTHSLKRSRSDPSISPPSNHSFPLKPPSSTLPPFVTPNPNSFSVLASSDSLSSGESPNLT